MNLLYGLRRARDRYGEKQSILDGARSFTYSEFYNRVVRLANALRSYGVQPGDRAAVLMLNSHRYLELYFATAMSRVAIVPMNVRWAPAEMAHVLQDSGARILFIDVTFAAAAASLKQSCPEVSLMVHSGVEPTPDGMISYEEALAEASGDENFAEPEEHDLVGLFYTSGTTGGPKGAMLTHRNLLSNAYHVIIEIGLNSTWRWLHSAPMFHIANGSAMYALVIQGATHIFIPAFQPEAFLEAIERHRVTAILQVPAMLNMLLNSPALDQHDTSGLKYLLYGASPMPPELLRRAIERLPQCSFWQGYGMTETGPLLTILPAAEHRLERQSGPFVPTHSVGRPIVGVEVRVVDPGHRPLPPGVPGQVIARGANVMKGYWNRPVINAEVLAGGWMHTGDVGVFDEQGFLYILDRLKEMIKTGSENVYTPEVESVLYQHPAVAEAAVIGIPHEQWGETIRAIVIRKTGEAVTQNELIDFCRSRLTHFKCPTSVDFVESLPRTATGKIRKAELKQRYS